MFVLRILYYAETGESDRRGDSDDSYEPYDRSSTASITTVMPRGRLVYDYLVGDGVEEYREPKDAVKVCKILRDD